jgi:hypothetical protein
LTHGRRDHEHRASQDHPMQHAHDNLIRVGVAVHSRPALCAYDNSLKKEPPLLPQLYQAVSGRELTNPSRRSMFALLRITLSSRRSRQVR